MDGGVPGRRGRRVTPTVSTSGAANAAALRPLTAANTASVVTS